MSFHRNAKLGLAGRFALVAGDRGRNDAEGGRGRLQRVAGDRASLVASLAARRLRRTARTLACLFDRSSRPHGSPRAARGRARRSAICACRRETGWGPRLVAGATGFAHSTVWKVLRRAGISRPPRPREEPANSYEWPCPGDLLHMDVCRYARFLRPGHAVTGDRSQRTRDWMQPETRVGYDYAHAIVDDHSRLAYVELHDDERAADRDRLRRARARLLRRARDHAKRLMTDNAFSYVKNRSLRELLARHGIRHLTTQPYRPRTNGKVERFHQTMAREWAYGLAYRSHHHRNPALPHWLDHYNRRRPHSSLGDRPPISRVHNVCG